MNGIVNANSQNDGSDKNRKRIELAVKKSGKRQRREARIQHRTRHENRAFHATEKEHRQQENKNQTDSEGEDTVVRHIIHFFQTFISSFHCKTGGHSISTAVEILQQRIGFGQNARDKFIIRRRF